MPTDCHERITLSVANKRVQVYLDQTVIADSAQALRLAEPGYPDRYYLPRAAVRAGCLTASRTQTHCPWKGDADYFHVLSEQAHLDDAAWCYAQPLPALAAIAGHVAFDHPRLAIIVDGP